MRLVPPWLLDQRGAWALGTTFSTALITVSLTLAKEKKSIVEDGVGAWVSPPSGFPWIYTAPKRLASASPETWEVGLIQLLLLLYWR